MFIVTIVGVLMASTVVSGAATNATVLQNGETAQLLNLAFQTMDITDACTNGDKACLLGGIASCGNSTWVVGQGNCSRSQSCFAVPTDGESGILVTCTTEKKAAHAIAATGATSGIYGNSTAPDNSGMSYTGTSNSTCSDQYHHRSSRDGECNGPDVGKDSTSASVTSTSPKYTIHSHASVDTPGSSPTSPATVTVTLTVGNEPTTLAPVTRTISPHKASIFLSLLMAHGATVIDSPSSTAAIP